jgi:hypothetical protein
MPQLIDLQDTVPLKTKTEPNGRLRLLFNIVRPFAGFDIYISLGCGLGPKNFSIAILVSSRLRT